MMAWWTLLVLLLLLLRELVVFFPLMLVSTEISRASMRMVVRGAEDRET
jgi:hypothetical protein